MNNFAFDFCGFKLFPQICWNYNHFHYMKKKGRREILDNSGNTEILSLADQFRNFFFSKRKGRICTFEKRTISNQISPFVFQNMLCHLAVMSAVWLTIEISWSIVILEGIPQEMTVVCLLLTMQSQKLCIFCRNQFSVSVTIWC